MNLIFILLIAFQIKHSLADFPLQTNRMISNKGKKTGWFIPLFSHTLVHALFTAAIIVFIVGKPSMLWLAAVELVAHFIIDRIKATSPHKNMLSTRFWNELAADQFAHQMCYVGIIYILARGSL